MATHESKPKRGLTQEQIDDIGIPHFPSDYRPVQESPAGNRYSAAEKPKENK